MAAWKDQCVTSSENEASKGGQHVGVTRSIIKVVHTPTGLTAICGYERSQHRCRTVCFDMIEYGLTSMGWSTE
jgi:protein subunit release factor A